MDSTFQLPPADPSRSPKGTGEAPADLLRLPPPLGLGGSEAFRAAAQGTLPLARLSGWLGAGRLAPAFRAAAETFSGTQERGQAGGRAWSPRPAPPWETQRSELESRVPRMLPAAPEPAPCNLLTEGERGKSTRNGRQQPQRNREEGLESAARAAQLPLPLFSLSCAAPRPPGERSAEQPTSTSLVMSASGAASE